MTIDEFLDAARALDGVHVQTAAEGDGSPDIAWGDSFVYVSPTGEVPARQPFATVVTKDHPGDDRSRLGDPAAFRVNLAVGAAEYTRLLGRAPRDPAPADEDPATRDRIVAHPVYGSLGWVSVVEPGERTDAEVGRLLALAHRLECDRVARREV